MRRASAAAAALESSADEEDRHEMETHAQLRTTHSLLQAHSRCALHIFKGQSKNYFRFLSFLPAYTFL